MINAPVIHPLNKPKGPRILDGPAIDLPHPDQRLTARLQLDDLPVIRPGVAVIGIYLRQHPGKGGGVLLRSHDNTTRTYIRIRNPFPVPHDIGVVGFDNWELFSTTSQPPLTTVDMNLEDMGRAVAEELQEAISVQPRPGRRRPCFTVRSCPAKRQLPVEYILSTLSYEYSHPGSQGGTCQTSPGTVQPAGHDGNHNRKFVKMYSLKGAVVLVTGANGGIGTHFVHTALARGASKVYATARTPRTWDDNRIVPLTLDITDPSSIQAAVEAAPDATVLINNAGASVATSGILSHTDAEIRANVETNFLGPLFLARAFAPILSAKDNAAIVDIHSAMSWYAVGGIYSATKAALWSATNSLRLELAPEGVHVVGVHVGYVDTAMAAHTTDPKMDPAELVNKVLDAVEAGEYEVLADETSVQLKAGLSAPIEALYPQLSPSKSR